MPNFSQPFNKVEFERDLSTDEGKFTLIPAAALFCWSDHTEQPLLTLKSGIPVSKKAYTLPKSFS